MTTINYVQVRIAAVLGALAVILGATGAHGSLHDQMLAAGQLDHWNTATHYHLVHAGVLLALAMGGFSRWGARLITAGVFVFSGSLYVLAITGVKWLGAITPIGGLLMIVGWLLVAAKR